MNDNEVMALVALCFLAFALTVVISMYKYNTMELKLDHECEVIHEQ